MHEASNSSLLGVHIIIMGLLNQLSVMCFLSKDVSLTAPCIAAMYRNAVHKIFVPSTHIFFKLCHVKFGLALALAYPAFFLGVEVILIFMKTAA